MNLQNNTILITGGTSGFGYENEVVTREFPHLNNAGGNAEDKPAAAVSPDFAPTPSH